MTKKKAALPVAKKSIALSSEVAGHHHSPAEHHSKKKALNRVIGQIEGIQKMIDDHRYCVDILIQTRAAAAALKKIELTILQSHINHCVKSAFKENDPNQASKKIEELMKLLEKY